MSEAIAYSISRVARLAMIHPAIDRVFALEEYDTALKYMASNEFVGKIVLKL